MKGDRMIKRSDFQKVGRHLYEIGRSYRSDMRVPARIYADEEILEATLGDRSIEQLVNTATLPGIVSYALAMPDIHQGYGFPIGGVVATELPKGVISPGGIGYDINCGVRMMASNLTADEVRPHLGALVPALYSRVPSGLGAGGVKVSIKELDELSVRGAEWAVAKGYGTKEDLRRTEEFGRIDGADPSKVSQRAKERGRKQVGSLGSGNHFLEVDEIDEIYDEEAARVFGLALGNVAVQIHCGSRGYGHQVCTDYVRNMQGAVRKYGIELPDRELVCVPWDSPEGQSYFRGMAAAANFAFVNRMTISHWVRQAFEETVGPHHPHWELRSVYDIAHNIGKIETHQIDGSPKEVVVHRKGATRAFGPGFQGLPEEYRPIGQPVLVPGSMGTFSFVLAGTEEAMAKSFGSTCHGAGRTMSRTKAKKTVWGEDLRKELEARGIVVRAGSMAGLAEEAPIAYKDVRRVVDVVSEAGIAIKVARLRPIGVVKG